MGTHAFAEKTQGRLQTLMGRTSNFALDRYRSQARIYAGRSYSNNGDNGESVLPLHRSKSEHTLEHTQSGGLSDEDARRGRPTGPSAYDVPACYQRPQSDGSASAFPASAVHGDAQDTVRGSRGHRRRRTAQRGNVSHSRSRS